MTVPPATRRRLQDIASVLLVLTSLVGLVVIAFDVGTRLGLTAVFGCSLAAGIGLGMDVDRRSGR